MRLYRALLAALPLLATAARADYNDYDPTSMYDAKGLAAGRETPSLAPEERVDPFSGNLHLAHVDLQLPGVAGMGLAIRRVYNSKIHPNFENNQDTTLEERSWVGVGWRLHFGRVINPSTATPGGTAVQTLSPEMAAG